MELFYHFQGEYLLISNRLCDIINSPKIRNLTKEHIGMKKARFILAMILTLAILCGCSEYVSNYYATILITSCQGDEASMEFETFNGTYNFKLKGNNDSDHTLDCEASLAEGEMKVYIGVDGEKELLFTIKGGESYDGTITLDDKYDNERVVYIILESTDKCVYGDFEFEYN